MHHTGNLYKIFMLGFYRKDLPERKHCAIVTPMSETLTSSEAAALLDVNVQKFFRLVAAHGISPVLEAPGLRGAKFWRRKDIAKLAAKAAA